MHIAPMHIERAAAPLLDLIPALGPHLDAPTPCTEYTVRQLVNHLLFWTPVLTGAATKTVVAPPAATESDIDLADGDRLAALTESVTGAVKAWSDPTAWQGTTRLGAEMPAEFLGAMVAGELVVHGWDLARAAGVDLRVDQDVAEELLADLSETAGQGRQQGVFAAEVPVPADAPTLSRLVGLTGRDPKWTVS